MPTEPMKPVVVGVDGSSAGAAALDLAAQEAARRPAPLAVVHVTGRLAGRGGEDPVLAAAVAKVRSRHPALPVAAELVPGEPAQVLARRSRDACLLVVGHRGRCGYDGVHVGSVAMRVASLAEVPVIVHRPADLSTAGPGSRPVLVGVASRGYDSVLRFAFLEASLHGAPLLVIPAAGADRPDGGAPGPGLAEALARWSDKYPEVAVRLDVRPGLDIAVVLTAASRTAQLVVVGLSGAGRATRMLTGSVTRTLVHRAGCPVAVVPVG